MKNIFYILILFAVTAQAQVHKMPADTEFFYTYGGVNFDEARDIKETPDKGYILAGTTSSFGQGNTSFYLIKTDSLGNHKWSSVQGGSQNDWAYTVQTTHDSGIFVAGFSNSFDPTGNNIFNAYYLKTDKNGHLLWQKTVPANDYSFIYGSYPMPDSGFILCGKTYANSHGNADGYLIRINKNGDTLWTRNYGGIQDEIFNSVCVINHSIYAVGSNSSHPTDTASDGWIVKLDINGNQVQDIFISFGTHQQEVLNVITPYDNTNFFIGGANYINNNGVDTNATNGILSKMDTSLVPFNLQNINSGTKNSEFAINKIINISHGNICTIGTRNGGLGGLGMFLNEFDLYGNYIPYYFIAGGISDEHGYSGIYTSSGKVISIGSTLSYGAGAEDAFLVRFNSDSIYNSAINTFVQNSFTDTLYLAVASIKNFNNDFAVKLFPNPSNGNIQLQINGSLQKSYTAKVYTILGSEIYSYKVQSNNNNALNFSSLDNGSYFLKIEDADTKTVSILKFIINK
ncbi:MAG: T9SS type A sorting domain-containing protein [Bacteroidia bacterium]